MSGSAEPVARRRVLRALGGTLAVGTAAGCVESVFGPTDDGPEQLSVTIKSLPSDEDPPAADIARRLTEHLSDIGANALLQVKTETELVNDLFYEHDFDIFVARFPNAADPDGLFPLLHSSFADEIGWQNPFGLEDEGFDTLLEIHRQEPDDRHDGRLDTIQTELVDIHPFSVVAIPEEITAIGEHLAQSMRPLGLIDPLDVLRLEDESDVTHDAYRIGLLTTRITVDHNPLSPQFPAQRLVLGLVYDPLLKRLGDRHQPWLGTNWQWDSFDERRLAVTLRANSVWHDDTPVTADDVVFTYQFLRDLTLGEADDPIPAPRFRGRTSPIESIESIDEEQVLITFGEVNRRVARRCLTVPILPQHVWEDHAGADDDGTPVAMDAAIESPVGSGPFAFDAVDPNERIVLARNDRHFLFREDAVPNGAQFLGRPPISSLEFIIPTHPPTVGSALSMVADEALDVVKSIPHHEVAAVNREPAVTQSVRLSDQCYIVGFNDRRAPTDSRAFRRFVGRLIDRTFLTAAVFRGHARPADSLFEGTDHVAEDLAWDGESILGPFPGSSGILDTNRARELALEAGFTIDEDQLLSP